MVFPRIERWSRVCGFLPFTVSLTDFKCVFMLMSTPVRVARARENSEEEEEEEEEKLVKSRHAHKAA